MDQELPSVVPLINWEDVLDEAELLDLAGPGMQPRRPGRHAISTFATSLLKTCYISIRSSFENKYVSHKFSLSRFGFLSSNYYLQETLYVTSSLSCRYLHAVAEHRKKEAPTSNRQAPVNVLISLLCFVT